MRFNFAFLYAAVFIVVAGCNSNSTTASAPKTDSVAGPKGAGHLTKLLIDDTKVGTGDAIENHDEAWVLYKGKLANGTVFDTNMKKDGEPFHVMVGQGAVIKGWDQGLIGMKKGGKRKLSVPYNLGYQDRSMGKIPAFSDLYFEIELLDVLKAKHADEILADDVKQGTGREAKSGDVVTVEYDAAAQGQVYETTKELKKPLILKIGADQSTVRGFDEALVGMKVGGVRTVKVPPLMTMTMQNDKLRSQVVTFTVRLVSIK